MSNVLEELRGIKDNISDEKDDELDVISDELNETDSINGETDKLNAVTKQLDEVKDRLNAITASEETEAPRKTLLGKKPAGDRYVDDFDAKKNPAKSKSLFREGTWLYKNWSWSLASIIVLIYFIIFMAVAKVAPFGGNSFTMVDSMHQYVPFFGEYQYKLKTFGSLFYTWDVGGGQNFQSLLLYYMACPLNLIIALFSKKSLIGVMSSLVMVKMVFSAGAFSFFLSRKNGKPVNNLFVTAFGVAYGLCNYMIGYLWNIMWLDCIMVLPLIVLGYEKLMKEGDFRMYVISLFYSFFCNYYISFMICIFLVLWFFTSSHGNAKKDGAVKAYFSRLIPDGIKFGLYSILAAAMACISLLTAYLAITKTASAKLNFPKWEYYSDFIEMLKSSFMLTKPITNQVFDGGVNIYAGTFAIVLVMLYIFSDRIELFAKIRHVVLLGFFILSFNTKLLNYIWHGFHDQYGIPNRFAFLYVFTLLVMSYEAISKTKRLSMIHAVGAGLASFSFLAICIYKTNMATYAPKWTVQLVAGGLIAAYVIMLCIRVSSKKAFGLTTKVISILMIVEMLTNAGIGMGMNGVADGAYHIRYTEAAGEAVAAVKAYAESEGINFYREDMVKTVMLDEATYNNMKSLGTFCSTVRGDMVTAMGALGFYTGANEYLYDGATALTDDMLGVRFIYANKGSYYPEGERLNPVFENSEITVFENEDALPPVYAVDKGIMGWNPTGPKVAENLNRFVRLSSDSPDVFKKVRPSYTVWGKGCSVGVSSANSEVISYTATDKSVSLSVRFTVEQAGSYVMNIRANYVDKVNLVVNGEQKIKARKQIQMFDLGDLKEGDEVDITVEFNSSRSDSGTVTFYAATVDEERIKEFTASLQEKAMKLEVFKDSYLKGSIHLNEDDMIMTSIPYDEGWKVKVDGQKVEPVKIGGAFMGLNIPAGDHVIEFSFVPQGMTLGAIVSIVGWLIFIGLAILRRHWEKYL